MFSVATRRVLNNAAPSVPPRSTRRPVSGTMHVTIPPTMKVRFHYHSIGFIIGEDANPPTIEQSYRSIL